MNRREVRPLLVAAFVLLCVLAIAAPAFGYNELTGTPVVTPDAPQSHNVVPGCGTCHPMTTYDCGQCHRSSLPGDPGMGPHGRFSSSFPTDKCQMCHTLHGGPGPSIKLLPRATLGASCDICHDGTGGYGVYGALAARGVGVKSAHRIETSTVIPGGDLATGGDVSRVFRGQGGTLTCSDCHTPHGYANAVVAAFVGDRQRTTLKWQESDARHHVQASTKLLKRRPTGATTPTTAYGSDWCLGCHAGRASGTPLHNHPVDSAFTTTTPFTYSNVAVVTTIGPTRSTQLMGLGGWDRPGNPWVDPVKYAENRGYLIPFPRSTGAGGQGAHAPICQQCHEDARDAGSLDATGLAITTRLQITKEDGRVSTDTPRFQNFPHEAENRRFLVEDGDDLCTNCHPTGALP